MAQAFGSSFGQIRSVSQRMDGDRSGLAVVVIAVLAFLMFFTAIGALFVGASEAAVLDVLLARLGFLDRSLLKVADIVIVENIRIPRIILGMFIGAGLAVSGAVMQGLFRNPLADPGIVGVSAGAALGAVSIIVIGGTLLADFTETVGAFALPVAAFFGALFVTSVLYAVATRHGRTSVATMLLAGIAIGAFSGALIGIFTFMADDLQLRELTFWGLGSLAGATWMKIFTAGPIILVVLFASPFLAKSLNALALGENAAMHVGIPVQRMKNIAIIMVSASTGAAVAVSGGIGFVGIVVPHILRLAIGPDHRYLLPASALFGAVFIVLADCVSRIIVAPAELPIGIVTATIGAPFFLWILLRRRDMMDM
ncbi:MAG: iron chelate uptake ABC transporter family permease subunit [Ahrensia sp.]|nr:iron chelate uptake ABC transporter family permease subunit [Ahrensia sp.]